MKRLRGHVPDDGVEQLGIEDAAGRDRSFE
jgi:hypothetical protein